MERLPRVRKERQVAGMATRAFLFSVIDEDVSMKISGRSILLSIRSSDPLNLLKDQSSSEYICFLNCIYSVLC